MTVLLVYLPFSLVLVTLQATFFERISLAGGHADLVLISLVLFALWVGRPQATVAAIVVAPFYDLMSGLPVGTSILPFLVVVYLAGMGERTLFGARFGWPLILTFMATFVAGLITVVELALFGFTVAWDQTILRVIVPSALLNAICILPLYLAIESLRQPRLPATR